MITFKDIINLNPSCSIRVNNVNLVDLYNNSDEYIITDMKICGINELELLVCPKDGWEKN
jgi:hypothetical protein